VTLRQHTQYPNDGLIRIELDLEGSLEFGLALRLPGWCREPRLTLNGETVDLATLQRDGYACIHRRWTQGDQVELLLPMPVERVRAHPEVRADAGRVALQRGPLVYCLEEVDNGKNLGALSIPKNGSFELQAGPFGLLMVEGPAWRLQGPAAQETLYTLESLQEEAGRFRAIPYHAWGNRGAGEMQVWIREGT
jgi:DUF1680 family protein